MSQGEFIRTVKHFLKQNAFLTCFWRFLRPNILEQLEFKLEKIIGIQKSVGKVRKNNYLATYFVEVGEGIDQISFI